MGTTGCNDLLLLTKGYVSRSNSIFLKLNNPKDKNDICFLLRTSNGMKDMIMDGTYNDTNETCWTSNMSNIYLYCKGLIPKFKCVLLLLDNIYNRCHLWTSSTDTFRSICIYSTVGSDTYMEKAAPR